MHPIYFYRDKQGKCPVIEYLDSLAAKSDKDSRIKLKKIQDYMHILEQYGKMAVGWHQGSFVLLHSLKRTQKTPAREIEKAKRELSDLKERSDCNAD